MSEVDSFTKVKQRSTTSDTMEGQQSITLSAYKRSPDLSNSRCYKGMLHSRMAGSADNHGAFDFVISKIRRGTEPPPHVHTREDEFFYLLAGEMAFYVDGKAFSITAGECMFLPRRIPHAWLITSDDVNTITVVTPAGFADAIWKMSFPAERMEVPKSADMATYANSDLAETIRIHEQHGVRPLSPDEIRAEMPGFPL